MMMMMMMMMILACSSTGERSREDSFAYSTVYTRRQWKYVKDGRTDGRGDEIHYTSYNGITSSLGETVSEWWWMGQSEWFPAVKQEETAQSKKNKKIVNNMYSCRTFLFPCLRVVLYVL